MAPTATLKVGIACQVMLWPTYDLSILQKLPIPVIAAVVPGKHTTRKGWLTKDFHYPQSPYTSDINAPIWMTQYGKKVSLRRMAKQVAWYFRRSIRRFSDPFSFRLLFAILDGRAPSMLELIDRPTAYDHVGHLCCWGMVLHELKNYDTEMSLMQPKRGAWDGESIDDYVLERERARAFVSKELDSVGSKDPKTAALMPSGLRRPVRRRRPGRATALTRRRNDTPGRRMRPRSAGYLDRRGTSLLAMPVAKERRRRGERRKNHFAFPYPDLRLTRSAYDKGSPKLVYVRLW